jgi:hypothetical protein
MFLEELSPLIQEVVYKPIVFMGGFVSGLFQLNLTDDPVKSWLDREMGVSGSSPSGFDSSNNGGGPQSIEIE